MCPDDCLMTAARALALPLHRLRSSDAFELTKGYTLHAPSGEISLALVACSFLGTLLSGQLQAAAQGMWPYGSGAGGGMGDALPFFIGYFVDGVVLAYDTPPPPVSTPRVWHAAAAGKLW